MNPYTIVKVLGLCLGAASVVTRTLPEQRSEIGARVAGGYGFSNTLTKDGGAGAEIEISVPNATTGEHFDALPLATHHMTFIPDQLDQRLEGMDHVVFSKRTDARFYICGISSRGTKPERPIPEPNKDDCEKLREQLSNNNADFTVEPGTSCFPSRFRRIITPE
jgi:hypothetical protein